MRLLSLASVLVTGCWFEGDRCPNVHLFAPGTYQSQGGQWRGGAPGQFPHDGPAKTLTLKRDGPGSSGGTVTITYQRDGKQVVERWYLDPARWVPLDAAQLF